MIALFFTFGSSLLKYSLMKSLPLEQVHISLGAKMLPFAGYKMPIEYSGIINEHKNVRTKVGIFDVSHMGEFWVKGPEAMDLLQAITTNDLTKIEIGKAQYSCFTNEKGGIIDDLVIYQYEEKKYMVVVNAANIDNDWKWINKHNTYNADIENGSDKMGMFAVQGPNAIQVLQQLTEIDLSSIEKFHFVTCEIAREDNVIISNTGYTGAGGFELYFYNESGRNIWKKIMEAGQSYEILPVGLGARDTLRLEMGYCLHGSDIDETTTPLEAGLGWITKINENNKFIGSDFLLKQKNEGIKRKIIGFELIDRGIPRHGYEIYDENENMIGSVTSGTISPMLNKGIGMGYVIKEFAIPESIVLINIRNKFLKAKIVKFPFYKG